VTLVLRAAAAFIALPGVVAFLIPMLVVRANGWPTASVAGWPLLVAGTALLLWCVAAFFASGRGTLAPWDPPRQLVVRGPYRISRNPMYVGVLLILAGWATTFRLSSLVLYAVAVAVAFHLRIILNEEPFLKKTHRDFPDYASRVPRWLRLWSRTRR
jgi:protein-S-isoprenylcysteine O-methyltransferase Ste14